MKRAVFLSVFLAAAFSTVASAAAQQTPCAASFPMSIAYGADVSNCKLSQVGQIVLFNFPGTAGDHITIAVAASWSAPCIGLYDPANKQVGSEACGDSRFGVTVTGADFTLASTGQYTIRVHDSGFITTGTFGLMLDGWYPVTTASPLVLGQTAAGTTVNPETIDDWSFSGNAGEDVTVQVNASYSAPCFILDGPTGTLIGSGCGDNRFGVTQIMKEFTLPANGTYLVRVYSIGYSQKGTYSMLAQCLAACSAIPVPAPTGVSPASGSGPSQVMTFTFSNPTGSQNLDVVNVLINNVLDGRNACYLAYSRGAGALYLVADNGGTLSTGLVLGGAGSVSNSQCAVTGASSAAAGAGNTLTLTLNIAFTGSLAGNRVVYMAARNTAGGNSGWQALGVWQVPGSPQVTSTAAVSMTPAQGSGLNPGTFTFSFSDTKGFQDLGVENILVNDSIDGRHACYLAYARLINVLYLINDNGDLLLPGQALTGPGALTNSQCAVSWGGSAVNGSGNNLNLTLNIAFKAGFGGYRVFYLAARDSNEGNNTGWQSLGTWAVQ